SVCQLSRLPLQTFLWKDTRSLSHPSNRTESDFASWIVSAFSCACNWLRNRVSLGATHSPASSIQAVSVETLMIPFAGSPLNRASEKRTNRGWIESKRRDPSSLILPLWRLEPFLLEPKKS